jgi:hypothetical protein
MRRVVDARMSMAIDDSFTFTYAGHGVPVAEVVAVGIQSDVGRSSDSCEAGVCRLWWERSVRMLSVVGVACVSLLMASSACAGWFLDPFGFDPDDELANLPYLPGFR